MKKKDHQVVDEIQTALKKRINMKEKKDQLEQTEGHLSGSTG